MLKCGLTRHRTRKHDASVHTPWEPNSSSRSRSQKLLLPWLLEGLIKDEIWDDLVSSILFPWPLWFTGGLPATFTTIVGHPVNMTTTPRLFWGRKLMDWMASDFDTYWKHLRYFVFFFLNFYSIKKRYMIRQFLKDLAMVYIPRYGCWLPKFLAIQNPREIPDSNLASLFDQCARLILKRSQIPKKEDGAHPLMYRFFMTYKLKLLNYRPQALHLGIYWPPDQWDLRLAEASTITPRSWWQFFTASQRWSGFLSSGVTYDQPFS